jgi:hypothetical protein
LKHRAAPDFWRLFDQLPAPVQSRARRNYDLLKENPRHPSLHLKQIGRYWSVRIGRRHRALGVTIDDGVLWFWIGSHAEYDRLVG